MLTRRTLLAGLAALGTVAGPRLVKAARLPPDSISIQLYTLRDLLARDLEGGLRAIAEIGYTQVQQSGFHGRSAAEFKAALDAAGLVATAGHADIPQPFDAARWQAVLADANLLGSRYLDHSYFGRTLLGPIGDRAVWSAFARDLNEAGRLASAVGIAFGYHNHDAEFAALSDGSGANGLDVLMAETDPALVHLELDLHWLWKGAADPWPVIERYGPRIRQYHVKDMAADGSFADPGTGIIDFARVFAMRPAEQYIVERDDAGTWPRPPEDALITAEAGFRYLSDLEV